MPIAPEAEVTVRVKVACAMALGVNLMAMVQVWVGRSSAKQVLPEITKPAPKPAGTVSAPVVAAPVLVTVSVLSPL